MWGNDLTKKFGSAGAYNVHLVDGLGNPLAGKTIVMNINGVFYNRVTGSDGVASLNINLPAGQYIITATYEGINAGNTITITN